MLWERGRRTGNGEERGGGVCVYVFCLFFLFWWREGGKGEGERAESAKCVNELSYWKKQ